MAAGLSAGVSNIAVTLLFDASFPAVNRGLSLLARRSATSFLDRRFLPHFLRAPMPFAGLGRLRFASTHLRSRSSYNLMPRVLGVRERALFSVPFWDSGAYQYLL
jgi:hypothetical protein